MAIKFVSRGEWGARPSRGASSLAGTRGVKVHYTGAFEQPAMRDDHDRYCAERVRQIQNGHMDDRGWNDIAYSYLACVHGYVFEGRGVHILPAANGAGLNAGHYAVCALIGNKGLINPSALLYDAICDAITLCRDNGNAGREVLGHRDGYATDCPGDLLYTWVEQGAPCGVADNEGAGEDMPNHVKVTLGKPMTLPAGTWSSVWWHTEAHDPNHQHADAGGPSVLNGPAAYALTASLVLTGLPAGAEYQMRAVEVDADGKEAATLGPIGEGLASSGDTYALYNVAAGRVHEGRRVRVQIKPIGHNAVATAGACELSYWR